MKITPTCEMNANEAFHGHKRDNSQFMHKREFSKSSDFLTASCGPNCKSQAAFSNVSGVAWTAGTVRASSFLTSDRATPFSFYTDKKERSLSSLNEKKEKRIFV